MEGAHVFEPMPGRPMNGYIAVPPSMLATPEVLEDWVAIALAHGASLPPKAPKAAKAKAKAAKSQAGPAARTKPSDRKP
jgi:hypothetical protein